MMSAEETENCNGAELRKSGAIHAHDNPLQEMTTMFPPTLLPVPVTGVKVLGVKYWIVTCAMPLCAGPGLSVFSSPAE